MCRRPFLILAFLLPAFAAAFTPESGFYNTFTRDANGGEGTGIAIEIQNDYMFAAGFAFRPDGSSTTVTIEGQLTHRLDGSWGLSDERGLYTYSGGQCIGSLQRCPYKADVAHSIGGFAIRFDSENEGTLEWGASDDRAIVDLRRTCVGSICYDAPSSLLGEWDVILDQSVPADRLRFAGDKLAIVQVSPSGKTRTISGCIAASEAAAPDCSKPRGRQTIAGNAELCAQASCASSFHYFLSVRTENSRHAGKIVRVYAFGENGHGGAFGGTIRGTVNLCPAGVNLAEACAAIKNIPFVAYRSGSVNFVRTGDGMN